MNELEIPPHHDPACWGCGDTAFGLELPPPEVEGLELYETYLHFGEGHQGGSGIVHGGLLATWYRFPTVTARIFVRYRHPVRSDLLDGKEALAEAQRAE